MSKKRYTIKDINRVYTELYSDASLHGNYPMVRAVFDSLRLVLSECDIGDKVIINNIGTFEICKQKKLDGNLTHWKTKKPMLTSKGGSRIKFIASTILKRMRKERKCPNKS
jgi:nucleoid DNA-binding protein